MFIIKESIYGNMASVFHRTSISDLVNKVFDSGFKPGEGDTYGRGFYSTYELKSQLRPSMIDEYGPIIVKFACPISTFFIFDYEEFKKSPNFKKLKSPSKNEFLKAQFEFFKMDYSDFDFSKKPHFTSETALWCYKNIANFNKLCEGIVYTGQRDGQCLLAYNTKLVFPLTYSVDGKTWEKVELNKDYLKKVAKVKNRFIPDLSVKPEDFDIIDYEYHSNGFLNVHQNVKLAAENLVRLPFKFGVVDGYFYCSNNNLTSLKGAPQKVGGDFYCDGNSLTSLEGAPKEVGGSFICNKNNLTSLKGAPQKVGGDFYCSNNKLASLEGAPQKVGGDFYCGGNNLTSLEGAPQKVGGDFYCSGNNLTSLEGAPKEVGGSFNCRYNKLTSLEGAPQKVGGNFDCDGNNLTSLEGAPKEVGGNFDCRYNKTKFTVKDVEEVCKVRGKITV